MRVLSSYRVQLAVIVLVVLGLVASTGITWLHQQYMTRGVSTGEDRPGPIPHTDLNPMGINTFLHEEPDVDKVERTLDMIADGGFTYVRQIFPWSDIEPAPGDYWNEAHGVSTWEKYDRIVELAVERDLEIVARLDKPPAWARAGQPGADQFPDGPPDDYADFAAFVATVVERYRDRVRYIQLWNEPNLGVEWGGQEIDPVAFTELLRAGYEAAKRADPDVIVLMPGLAPTDQTGPHNLSDLLFLEGMYEAGAKDYFDIAAVMVYGYGFSPYDRRVSFGRNNFSRPIQTREIMERFGDGDKPVWAVEYGWVSLPDDWAGEASPWGRPVTEQQQADYLYHGYLRAQREWPWMGVMMVWAFRWTSSPDDANQIANPTRGFRIVDHDFTPRPAYERLSQARPLLDRAYTGTHDAGSRLIQADGWQLLDTDNGPILSPSSDGARLVIPFSGTGIELDFATGGGAFAVEIDGERRRIIRVPDESGVVTVASGLEDGPHDLLLVAIASDENPPALAGFTVIRRTLTAWIYSYLYAALALVTALNLASLALTVRRRPARQVAVSRPAARPTLTPTEV
jgi:polysaccharide biosynthesis protein PslG